MNAFLKKMLVFLLMMAVLAGAARSGRNAYKQAVERRAVSEAGQFYAKGDARNAFLSLQRALQINPLSLPAAQAMADMLESSGVPAALGWRIHVAQLQPHEMTNRLLWAQTALKLHDAKSAADALGGVAGKAKDTAQYHKLSGALAWSQNQREEALQQYREAQRLEPGNLSIVMNLDTIGLASTNTEAAAAARASLEHLATNAEYRVIALRYLTADAGEHKAFKRAINYSAEIVRDPAATVGDKIDHLQLLHLAGDTNFASWLASLKQGAAHSYTDAFALGKWMILSGDANNALRWLASLPPTIQTNQPVPLVIADCYITLQDWPGLVAFVDKQDWDQANSFRLALAALGRRSLQQDTAWQADWRKAVRLSAHRLDQLARLSQVSASWGWDAENTEVLQQITAEFPKEKWAADQLINKLYAAGKTRELAELVARIYAADSSNPRLKNNLANLSLLRKVDLTEAHRLAREAYDSSPENPFFASTYAYSLLLQNKQDEALKILVSLKPEHLKIPSVAAYYGIVEAQSGHKDIAKAPLQLAAAAKLLPEESEMVRVAIARL